MNYVELVKPQSYIVLVCKKQGWVPLIEDINSIQFTKYCIGIASIIHSNPNIVFEKCMALTR